MDEYFDAIRTLPDWLRRPLGSLSPAAAGEVHEIRLRRASPVWFTIRGEARRASAVAAPGTELARLVLPQDGMEEILYHLCGGSVHTFSEELSHGFLTLPGGHRVGVGGRYKSDARGVCVLQKAESFDLRIARYRSCPLPPMLNAVLQNNFTGVLLTGEPDSGKTTMLRSIAQYLIFSGRQVAVIDERGEILPEAGGLSGAGDGSPPACDRIAGVDKALGLEMALRALAPQVLILDELASQQECLLLEKGFNGGAGIVATMHADSLEHARQKPQYRFLAEHRMLQYVCQLEGRRAPCRVLEEKQLCG